MIHPYSHTVLSFFFFLHIIIYSTSYFTLPLREHWSQPFDIFYLIRTKITNNLVSSDQTPDFVHTFRSLRYVTYYHYVFYHSFVNSIHIGEDCCTINTNICGLKITILSGLLGGSRDRVAQIVAILLSEWSYSTSLQVAPIALPRQTTPRQLRERATNNKIAATPVQRPWLWSS
jgi:hypothetical protein